MSNNAKRYKLFYDKGFWTRQMLWNIVNKPVGGITPEEYEEITGFEYTSEEDK